MQKKQEQKIQKQQQNEKFFSKDNIPGIIAFAAVLIVALYVISTHLNLPTFVVPEDAVKITYPSSILSVPAKEQAENMKNTEGIYRVKVNSDGGIDIKMSPERYQKIKDAAKNAVESMTIISIGEETAVKDYQTNEDYTILKITVDKEIETLETEISDALYTVRLYHVCHMNNDVEFEVYYIDQSNPEVAYKCERYDIHGNVMSSSSGAIVYPEMEEPTDNTI
ncbi:MAG: hypothetical protein IJC69_06345 [Clostridia bacterium]|nr:hypothetical protein [Clostridia bacterium]